MNNDPVFDPVFNTTPLPLQGRTVPEGVRYRFDGWSYEPITPERPKLDVLVYKRHQ